MPGIAADTPANAADAANTSNTRTEPEARLQIERALEELAGLSSQTARILELYYFKRLPLHKIAIGLELSATRVAHELRFAKAWLRLRLRRDNARA